MRNDRSDRDPAPKAWTRPQLIRVGRIEDVAQQGPGTPQGGTKS